MRGKKALMSSARNTGESSRDEWATPRWLFERIQTVLGLTFSLDAAASDANHLADNYFTEQNSALAPTAHWVGDVWCNPPYSMLRDFARKAREELLAGRARTVTFLVPARTDTIAFHLMASMAPEIYFLKGRVKFVGAENGAPFPSAVIHMYISDEPQEVAFVDWRETT